MAAAVEISEWKPAEKREKKKKKKKNEQEKERKGQVVYFSLAYVLTYIRYIYSAYIQGGGIEQRSSSVFVVFHPV